MFISYNYFRKTNIRLSSKQMNNRLSTYITLSIIKTGLIGKLSSDN